MPTDHTERGFEQAIQSHLLAHGYEQGDPAAFDAALALDPGTLVRFLKATQPQASARLEGLYGREVETRVAQTVAQDLDQRGTLECLRHGLTDRGVKLQLGLLQPGHGHEPRRAGELYRQNVLTVTRQVHFSTKNSPSRWTSCCRSTACPSPRLSSRTRSPARPSPTRSGDQGRP
jgi:type I restriction enzyme R subunit